jgi:uncharacterized membrane protein YbhN (UPF0104 family)
MGKWLKNILALVLLAFLLRYLYKHWDELDAIFKINRWQIISLYFLSFLQTAINACVTREFIKTLGIKTSFFDMLRLQHAADLLNYAPMKFGTLFRANYLKHHYNLGYAYFATLFLYMTFVMTAAASATGFAALTAVYGIASHESKVLAAVFALTIAGCFVFLFTPLPQPSGAGKWRSALRDFLAGRKQISRQRKAVLTVTILLWINVLLTALRLALIYNGISENIHPAGYLILGALGFVVLFIGITPGALGIREIVLSSGALVLGVKFEVGLLAAMIDRAITVSYVFTVGVACAAWLWYKSPAEFRELKELNRDLTQ